jgi:hypothetical protein
MLLNNHGDEKSPASDHPTPPRKESAIRDLAEREFFYRSTSCHQNFGVGSCSPGDRARNRLNQGSARTEPQPRSIYTLPNGLA